MASPISSDPSLGLGSQKAQAKDKPAKAETQAQPSEKSEAPARTDDMVTLSETARQMNTDAPQSGRGPNDPEQAQRLVEQLKEKIAANPGFAAAVHRVSDNSRLATLLDNFA